MAMVGDLKGIADADRAAKRKALDIIEGKIIAGSVAQLIERFRDEITPTHYPDQSKDGLAVRESGYKNLTKFFGKMAPKSLRMLRGYQYLDAYTKAGAPAKANKELSLMSTICKYAVRWGVIEAMPFTDIMQNDIEKDVRTITRSQVVRFYLWSLRGRPSCAWSSRAPNRRIWYRTSSCSPIQKARRTRGQGWGRYGRTPCSSGSHRLTLRPPHLSSGYLNFWSSISDFP